MPDLDIPESTARTWIRNGPARVVTADAFAHTDDEQMIQTIAALTRKVAVLSAVVALLLALLRVSGFRLDDVRLASARLKASLLSAAESALKTLPLGPVLRILHLSPARYHRWKTLTASADCNLDDASTCPRSFPAQLTSARNRWIYLR